MPSTIPFAVPRRPVLLALAAALTVALVPGGPARAQDVEEQLRTLGAENARRYAQPVGSGLGAAMSKGWFSSALPAEPLEVQLGLRVVGGIVPPEHERFRPVLPASVEVPELGRSFDQPYGPSEAVVTPTVAGNSTGARLAPQGEFREALVATGRDLDDWTLQFPRGYDLPAVPMAVLQGSVGLPAGTELTARWLPSVEIDEDVGPLRSVGVGVMHGVSRWLPAPLPVDVAVGGGLQSFEVGDYLTADSRHATLVVSRTLSSLTLFGSGTVESTDYEVTYTVENPLLSSDGAEISFEEQAANTAGLTAGIRLDLLFLRLDASYSVSDYDVLRAGFGVGF